MLDRETFLRPIAHRGLHNLKQSRIENSASAFEAAIAKGYGIECDLRPASGGLPVVFHDLTLDRLIKGKGRVADLFPGDLKRLTYKASGDTLLSFADLLDLVDGKVPLLVEIKSDWGKASPKFLKAIAALVQAYQGPLGLMSFDPVVMAEMRRLAPDVPRGIVAGVYQGEGWWLDRLDAERAYRLTHLLECGPVKPAFVSYHVKALPTPVTRYVHEVQGLPIFTWTVRSDDDRRIASQWADAPIFEGPAA